MIRVIPVFRKWFIIACSIFSLIAVFDHAAATWSSFGWTLHKQNCTFQQSSFTINTCSTSITFWNFYNHCLSEVFENFARPTEMNVRFCGGNGISQQKSSGKQPNVVIIRMNIYNYSWAISHFQRIFLHHYCYHLKWIRGRNRERKRESRGKKTVALFFHNKIFLP